MPPYIEPKVNAFHNITGAKNTQLVGLDYEENYNYKYDRLLWNGTTPEDFQSQFANLCTEKRYAGIVYKDRSKTTTNNIRLVNTEDNSTISTIEHVFVTQAMKVATLAKHIRDFDLTDHLTKASYEVETNKVHLEVESFDENGDSIPAIAYKPTFDYVDANSTRWIKIHVDYFEDYAPEIVYSDLSLFLEFYTSDGSYSDQVKGVKIDKDGTIVETDIVANAPVAISHFKYQFSFQDHIFTVRRDPLALLSPMSEHQRDGAAEDCLPTERDPCHGAGCVKVVPWSIKYLQDHNNTVRSRLVH